MLSLDLSSLVSLFELSFSYLQDVLIWCTRFLTCTYLYHHPYLLIRVAYIIRAFSSFPFGITCYHHYSSLSLPVHILPSCLFSPRWFPHHLYRHYRDTISTRPSTRWDWHLTSGASTGLWLYMAVRDEPAALPCIPPFVIGLWQYISPGWTPLKVIDMVDQPSPGVSVISC